MSGTILFFSVAVNSFSLRVGEVVGVGKTLALLLSFSAYIAAKFLAYNFLLKLSYALLLSDDISALFTGSKPIVANLGAYMLKSISPVF